MLTSCVYTGIEVRIGRYSDGCQRMPFEGLGSECGGGLEERERERGGGGGGEGSQNTRYGIVNHTKKKTCCTVLTGQLGKTKIWAIAGIQASEASTVQCKYVQRM